jgi:hypothetical protein
MASDSDLNGFLGLEEWEDYTQKQNAALSKRIGVNLVEVAENEVNFTWFINRFEGKDGITADDFKKKVKLDGLLATKII